MYFLVIFCRGLRIWEFLVIEEGLCGRWQALIDPIIPIVVAIVGSSAAAALTATAGHLEIWSDKSRACRTGGGSEL